MSVLVIGGANLDIKAKVIAPHVPATSNPAHVLTKAGGVARNIAHNLARLGVATKLVTAVGQGAEAEMILAETAAAGVDISKVLRLPARTGTYLAVLDNTGELVTAVNDMAITESITPEIMRGLEHDIAAAGLVVADCNLRPDTLEALAAMAGAKLVIEPVSVVKSQKLLALLARHEVFLATPNLDQLHALATVANVQDGLRKLHALGLRNVVVHAGPQGAFASDGRSIEAVASQATRVVDVTGAGDAATAGLVAGLLQGLPLAKAAELGQKTAAHVIASESSTLP